MLVSLGFRGPLREPLQKPWLVRYPTPKCKYPVDNDRDRKGAITVNLVKKFEAQKVLFSSVPQRRAILELPPDDYGTSTSVFTVNVWQNHAFQSLVPIINSYYAHRSHKPVFRLSDPNDSVSFSKWVEADLELLWLDSDRYLSLTSFDDWSRWLLNRVRALRTRSDSPIIVAIWLGDADRWQQLESIFESIPAFMLVNLESEVEDFRQPLFDARLGDLTGSPLSSEAQIITSRNFACKWFPAVLEPPVKALVLDLDHTLYKGVLEEDGVQGIDVTPGHKQLQEHIRGLGEKGIFLAVLSKNNRKEVEKLFAERTDFPLRWENFSVVEASWGDKSVGMQRICEELRISPDSVVVVDDNFGELLSIHLSEPSVGLVLARIDGEETLNALRYFPGLWRKSTTKEDSLRRHDSRVSESRVALQREASNEDEYLTDLGVVLTFSVNRLAQSARLAELSAKTNQFNLVTARLNQAAIERAMTAGKGSYVIGIHLADRLSESGVVGLVALKVQADRLIVEEMCLSCRALGRNLEDSIMIGALRRAQSLTGMKKVAFLARRTAKNGPAIEWVNNWIESGSSVEQGQFSANQVKLDSWAPHPSITVLEAGEKNDPE